MADTPVSQPFVAPGTRLSGDKATALAILPEARKLLYLVKLYTQTAGVPTFKASRQLPGGSWIEAAVHGGQEYVAVFGSGVVAETPVVEPKKSELVVATMATYQDICDPGGTPFLPDGYICWYSSDGSVRDWFLASTGCALSVTAASVLSTSEAPPVVFGPCTATRVVSGNNATYDISALATVPTSIGYLDKTLVAWASTVGAHAPDVVTNLLYGDARYMVTCKFNYCTMYYAVGISRVSSCSTTFTWAGNNTPNDTAVITPPVGIPSAPDFFGQLLKDPVDNTLYIKWMYPNVDSVLGGYGNINPYTRQLGSHYSYSSSWAKVDLAKMQFTQQDTVPAGLVYAPLHTGVDGATNAWIPSPDTSALFGYVRITPSDATALTITAKLGEPTANEAPWFASIRGRIASDIAIGFAGATIYTDVSPYNAPAPTAFPEKASPRVRAYGLGVHIVVYTDSVTYIDRIYRSTDNGASWGTCALSTITPYYTTVAFGNGTFKLNCAIAVNGLQVLLYSSTDATAWSYGSVTTLQSSAKYGYGAVFFHYNQFLTLQFGLYGLYAGASVPTRGWITFSNRDLYPASVPSVTFNLAGYMETS